MLLIINRLTYQQKTSMMKRLHIYVSGIVQGVFFRQSTLTKAKEFGIYGWVKNLRDGGVEIVCEGNEESLKKMVIWCKKGPDGAFVSGIDVQWEDFKNEFKKFQIIY